MSLDLDLIRAAAHEAGDLALKLRKAGLDTQSKPGGSPVTNGDLAVDALLHDLLAKARPDYGWLSEETADNVAARMAAQRTFIIDPIDGTTAYAKDKDWWAVSIAIVENGKPTEGVVFAPALGELYEAERGGGARLSDQPITVTGRDALEGCAILSDPKMFAHPSWPIPWPDMAVSQRNSVAYRMAAVAAGKFDACLALSSKHDWDIAAADLIVHEAGGLATDHKGRSFIYNRADPRHPALVCAGPALHEILLERVGHVNLPYKKS